MLGTLKEYLLSLKLLRKIKFLKIILILFKIKEIHIILKEDMVENLVEESIQDAKTEEVKDIEITITINMQTNITEINIIKVIKKL